MHKNLKARKRQVIQTTEKKGYVIRMSRRHVGHKKDCEKAESREMKPDLAQLHRVIIEWIQVQWEAVRGVLLKEVVQS